MNKGIAHVLLKKLAAVPFIELKAGLVALQEEDQSNAADPTLKKLVKRFPVTDDYLPFDGAKGGLIAVIPDSRFSGISYFEDQGITPLEQKGGRLYFRSNLRLVAWINTKKIDTNGSVALPIAAKVIGLLVNAQPYNDGDYLTVIVNTARVPKTGKEIFSAYTYDVLATQYLMPPFEHFALDLTVTFSISPNCIDNIKPCTLSTC